MSAECAMTNRVERSPTENDRDAQLFARSTNAMLRRARSLSQFVSNRMMELIMNDEIGMDELRQYLALIAAKGATVDELVGSALAVRAVMPRLPTPFPVLDNCGTGGDRSGTFNISTAAALVVASAGQPVAKHGNRSSSGGVGSADIIEALGIALVAEHDQLLESLRKYHFAFLFAPFFRPKGRNVVEARRNIVGPTLFNLIGPLCNPAYPAFQVIGTFSQEVARTLAEASLQLDIKQTFVVSGAGGVDELVPAKGNVVFRASDGQVERLVVEATDAGLPEHSLGKLRGGTVQHNAIVIKGILSGRRGPQRDAVVMNGGLALWASGAAADLRSGCETCARAIDDGRAMHALDALRKPSSGAN